MAFFYSPQEPNQMTVPRHVNRCTFSPVRCYGEPDSLAASQLIISGGCVRIVLTAAVLIVRYVITKRGYVDV